MHGHAHSHADRNRPDSQRLLTLAVGLTLGYAGVEAVGGWYSGSLALLSDAGHMLSDSAALGLAALAAWMARRPPSPLHSYGLGRLETLAALFNGLLMVALVTAVSAAAAGVPPASGAQDLDRTVQQLNELAQTVRREIRFTIDDSTGRTVINVLDAETEELVRQIPSEEVLTVAARLKDEADSVLVDAQA